MTVTGFDELQIKFNCNGKIQLNSGIILPYNLFTIALYKKNSSKSQNRKFKLSIYLIATLGPEKKNHPL